MTDRQINENKYNLLWDYLDINYFKKSYVIVEAEKSLWMKKNHLRNFYNSLFTNNKRQNDKVNELIEVLKLKV
jgi:hypothetical protein